MVLDIAAITGAIKAAGVAIGLFDKITDQAEWFITKQHVGLLITAYVYEDHPKASAKVI
jgi:hypothetical protein